jgi:hypothetical protein
LLAIVGIVGVRPIESQRATANHAGSEVSKAFRERGYAMSFWWKSYRIVKKAIPSGGRGVIILGLKKLLVENPALNL